jgi:hypothetical protein
MPAAYTYLGSETILPSTYTFMSTPVDTLSKFASGVEAPRIGKTENKNEVNFMVTLD